MTIAHPRRPLIRILGHAFAVAERCVPTTDTLCFTSFPDVDDNALAVFAAALADARLGRRRLVWLVKDCAAARQRLQAHFGAAAAARCLVVRKNSMPGLWHFIRAEKVFFTHGHYSFVRASKSGRKLINLWHGMPLKAIGLLDDQGTDTLQASDATISSSEFFRPLMAAAFGLSNDDVAVTGLPRCDTLFSPSPAARALRQQLLADSERIVAWLPTYRISDLGDVRSDVLDDREACLTQFVDDLQALSALARQKRCTVLVKLHGMDFLNRQTIPAFERIRLVRADDPLLREIGIYDLLAVSDGLITDVSSVCFDYMVTRKPILITRHLLADYQRKLLFPVEQLIAALDACDDMASAARFFDAVLGHQCLDERRLTRFCLHADAGASRRVLERFIPELASMASSRRGTGTQPSAGPA